MGACISYVLKEKRRMPFNKRFAVDIHFGRYLRF